MQSERKKNREKQEKERKGEKKKTSPEKAMMIKHSILSYNLKANLHFHG